MKTHCPTCESDSVDRRRRCMQDKMLLQRRYICKDCSTVYALTLGLFRRTVSKGFHSAESRKA